MIAFAANGREKFKPLASKNEIRFKSTILNSQQRNAINHILTSGDKVMLIRGAAGTGKTTLTQEAVAQINERGKNVVMLAPSAQASRGVLRAEGFEKTDTLAKFVDDKLMQAEARDGIIWLDEASLMGTKAMAELFRLTNTLNARVVLSGDQYQHGSIERGAALRTLETIAKLPCAKVTEIQRQKPELYKSAVQHFSKGEISQGFEILDKDGAIKLLPVWDKYNAVAEDYLAKRKQVKNPDRDVVVVSPTHSEAASVTDAVRNELRKQGELGTIDHDNVATGRTTLELR
jgi:ATP-dependent exoDNAse (exonuclease V) alpha subunit